MSYKNIRFYRNSSRKLIMYIITLPVLFYFLIWKIRKFGYDDPDILYMVLLAATLGYAWASFVAEGKIQYMTRNFYLDCLRSETDHMKDMLAFKKQLETKRKRNGITKLEFPEIEVERTDD